MLEEVAHDHAAGGLIGFGADELRAPVRRPDSAFGELAADEVGFPVVGTRQSLPDLLLARMVVRDREGHELLQRHAVLGIDVEELPGDGGEAQALLHDGRCDEEARRDLLLAEALVAQGLKGAELVERMQGDALDILSEQILVRRNIGARIAHHAGDGHGLGQALLLDQQFERPVAAAARRDLEHASLGALGVEDRADAETLQERAPGDVLGQLLDRDAGLHAPDVALAQDQLVEGDVA